MSEAKVEKIKVRIYSYLWPYSAFNQRCYTGGSTENHGSYRPTLSTSITHNPSQGIFLCNWYRSSGSKKTRAYHQYWKQIGRYNLGWWVYRSITTGIILIGFQAGWCHNQFPKVVGPASFCIYRTQLFWTSIWWIPHWKDTAGPHNVCCHPTPSGDGWSFWQGKQDILPQSGQVEPK
jgi:hypothetical protein